MNRFIKRFVSSCLVGCLIAGSFGNEGSVSSVSAKKATFIDDFNRYETPTSTPVSGGSVTATPVVTAVPTVVPVTVVPTIVPVTEVPTVVPVVTEVPVTAVPTVVPVPTATIDPFDPGKVTVPEETVDPSKVTPRPTFSLERPDVDYYCYYDRMEWEKNNLKKNIIKYDEANGATKERNNKIPVRKVKYQKNKSMVTIKVKYGDCVRIKLTGIKKYKRVDYKSEIPERKGLRSWDRVRSTTNGKNYRCILVDYKGSKIFGFKVKGKLFKVKVVSVGGFKAKSAKSYEGMGYNSKWTWKSMMRNVISTGVLEFEGRENVKDCTLNKGRTRYCNWDSNKFYVQGYEIPLYTSGKKLVSLIYYGQQIDYIIEHYRIPSASEMTKDECCKWIRRNGKLLRSIYRITEEHGYVNDILSYALYPIFDKAYSYELSDKWTKNSLMFFHVYGEELNQYELRHYRHTWLNVLSSGRDIGYYDEELECWIPIWAHVTWLGKIYLSIQSDIR